MAVPASDAPGRITRIDRFGDVTNRKTLTYAELHPRSDDSHRAAVDSNWARLVRENEWLREENLRLGSIVTKREALVALVRTAETELWQGHDPLAALRLVMGCDEQQQWPLTIRIGVLVGILSNAREP